MYSFLCTNPDMLYDQSNQPLVEDKRLHLQLRKLVYSVGLFLLKLDLFSLIL